MPRFAANLTMLFNEVPFLERFEAAAQAGFKGVEYLFPYAFDKEALAEQLQKHGLTQVLHNLPAGNWEGGERGIACHPDRVGEFQDGVGRAIEYATTLGCKQINCLAGITPAGADAGKVHETLVTNLRFAAGKLGEAGIRLLVEPINTFDIPGFHVNGTAQAIALIDEVGSDKLFLQHDIYHMQRMEGELANTIARHLPRIAHMQIADNPGRNEPGTGEINYAWLFRFIDGLGYDGWIGCEYKPAAGTREGLGWIQALAG
ncbi:hydroxypyruvate isomerase [Thauera sp. Sel9]|uniref:hydroxypyruvate isomerase n=1 Tax=Thauera sp. Sel9 TaxID=2974299 RepID=UPI0021E14C41|nr:hydroxypyruvate isomerase [Thauera sp. Sel9]MCV2219734.1 hydroxypyruvate isomerase [Thauera sp. Sel9]